MKIYHGSLEVVDHPVILRPNRKLDYGEGFYTTTSWEQSKEWVERRMLEKQSQYGYVNVYEFDAERMPEFKSQEESDQIMGALAQHWEHIDSILRRNDEYYPFLYADPDGKGSANEWAYGFILGMDMRRDSWKEMVEASKQSEDGLLTPILTLYSEYIPEISGCQPIPAEEREELVTKMISNLPRIYEHFEEAREKNRQTSSLH